MEQDTFERAEVEDAVDAIIDQWRTQRPDLDPSAKHVTGRIVRLGSLFRAAYDDAFEALGIAGVEYGILSALRRAGRPYALTPTGLARNQMMTSGGMTSALDRLERKGLAVRAPNPADRRGTLVALTDAGLEVADEAMRRHSEVEHALIASLTPAQRDGLQSLLRTLLLAVDGV
jgi:DNA-binding MarR family transcriptional regulator